jgi:hypothetical protein
MTYRDWERKENTEVTQDTRSKQGEDWKINMTFSQNESSSKYA